MAGDRTPRGKGFHDPRYRTIIDQLIAEQRRQNLSQQALAQLLDRHQQFVSRYETGERRLDVTEFVDIANVLGMFPARLLTSFSH